MAFFRRVCSALSACVDVFTFFALHAADAVAFTNWAPFGNLRGCSGNASDAYPALKAATFGDPHSKSLAMRRRPSASLPEARFERGPEL